MVVEVWSVLGCVRCVALCFREAACAGPGGSWVGVVVCEERAEMFEGGRVQEHRLCSCGVGGGWGWG